MSHDKDEVVRLIHKAWSRRGSPVSSGHLDPGIEWVNPPEAVESGVRRGLDAFDAAARRVAEGFEDVRLEIDEYLDPGGDRVVAIGTWLGRGKGSGVYVERRMGFVWTVRAGRAVRFEWFPRPSEALESAGLG
jgi:ketosteroid isomerase-like protein